MEEEVAAVGCCNWMILGGRLAAEVAMDERSPALGER